VDKQHFPPAWSPRTKPPPFENSGGSARLVPPFGGKIEIKDLFQPPLHGRFLILSFLQRWMPSSPLWQSSSPHYKFRTGSSFFDSSSSPWMDVPPFPQGHCSMLTPFGPGMRSLFPLTSWDLGLSPFICLKTAFPFVEILPWPAMPPLFLSAGLSPFLLDQKNWFLICCSPSLSMNDAPSLLSPAPLPSRLPDPLLS